VKEAELSLADIDQISEFGQNPSQIFDRPHPAIDKRSIEYRVFDIFNTQQKYCATKYTQNEDYAVIKVISKSRNTLVIINSNSQIMWKSLISDKKTCRTIGEAKLLNRHFEVYSEKRKVFVIDPRSAFGVFNDYLISCRNLENSFLIYRLSLPAVFTSINFHKVSLN